jgi:hypothetical protein
MRREYDVGALGFGDVTHCSIVMKRKLFGVGCVATHFSKNARRGAPQLDYLTIKSERRSDRDVEGATRQECKAHD